MKPTASIIIPTWNNAEYLIPCINSIVQTGALHGLCELIIVNNGEQPIDEHVKAWPNTKVLKPGENLGWERGLEYGMREAQGEFICFQNDDTLIPKACQNFYSQLLWPFHDQNVAAVGPATTVASGWHSVFSPNAFRTLTEVSYLIFFTVMLRRSDLESVGGIDTSCPGGDDFDLSIRLRKAGMKLLVNPDAFLIHHAFKTGTRVKGEHTVAGGWNSKEMTERTNKWLIQKHGFKAFLETLRGLQPVYNTPPDSEAEAVAGLVRGETVVELGCGGRKTVPQAIGVDIVPKGERSGNIAEASVADIVADVTKPLPFNPESVDTIIARHILEHCVDPVETIRNWRAVLKRNGRLIIAVPNEDFRRTIPLNPEHRHGFTPQSLVNLVELCGFKAATMVNPQNGISFVMSFVNYDLMLGRDEALFAEAVHA
jgi:predicted SAM-dependent methyltransferase